MNFKICFLGLRAEYFLGFLLCLVAILLTLYLEFYQGLEPCPLCILQRVAVLGAGFFYLLAVLQGPKKIAGILYGVLILIFTLLGLFIAAKQIYIQHLPIDQVPACGPGLEYLRRTLPWNQFIQSLFQGDGSCAVVGPRFVFFSLSEWAAGLFLFLSLLNMHLIYRAFLLWGKHHG